MFAAESHRRERDRVDDDVELMMPEVAGGDSRNDLIYWTQGLLPIGHHWTSLKDPRVQQNFGEQPTLDFMSHRGDVNFLNPEISE
jgi:hypothetical protein